jgi:tripartite-type tricarboxylate transporter receptor subunit TctC
VTLLRREIVRILASEDIKERLTTIGFDIVASTPEEFDSRIRAEIEIYGKVIRAGNIKSQ